MHEGPRDWNDNYATGQTPWDSGQPSRELVRVLDERNIAPCRTLDLGCGTGTNAVYLAGRGFDVTGIDLSPLAIEKAKSKAAAAGGSVRFEVADIFNPPDLRPPFPFLFDRGLYHCLRTINLPAFLKTLDRVAAPDAIYLALTGNANDTSDPEQGPPRVSAREICEELEPLFRLIQLREFQFDGVVVEDTLITPLAWSVLLSKR